MKTQQSPDTVILGLKPEKVWKHFLAISRIPHCSGNEKGIADYISACAEQRGLSCIRDSAGNVRVILPAVDSTLKTPIVALQAHLDMVCEKNEGTIHDFTRNPLQLILNDNWLSANGTTLGADNGIGVACALAIMDSPEILKGPVELIFTVEEETGLTGALNIDSGFITAPMLINLDSEELGIICAGCAGGSKTEIKYAAEWIDGCKTEKIAVLRVRGLKGGHSGLDIDKKRGNAIKIIAQILNKMEILPGWELASISGGTRSNALPRESKAEIIIKDAAAATSLTGAFNVISKDVKAAYAEYENDLSISLEINSSAANSTTRIMSDDSRRRLIMLLDAIPHGVEKMSEDISGLVHTSNNLALVSINGKDVVIQTMARSFSDNGQGLMEEKVRASALNFKAESVTLEGYPGWDPELKSELLAMAQASYSEVTGSLPKVEAVHAGLECGIIKRKCPGIQAVSIGPTMISVHSPAEKVDVQSVEVLWNVLVNLLYRIAGH
jgi:dipeptidase D